MAFTSPGGPRRTPLLTAATTDETLGNRANCAGYPHLVIYITGTGVTSSGVITIEEADITPDAQDFTGGWVPITTVNASDVDGGLQKSVHLPVGSYGWVRTRISTVIGGGGTVSTVLIAS